MAQHYGSNWEYAKFILFAHILNPFWEGRVERRSRRNYYNYRRVAAYLKKYLPFVENLEVEDITQWKKGQGENPQPGKIYSIWFQGEENAPELVKVCFERMKKAYGDRYVILDKESIKDFIRLPQHIWQKWEEGKMKAAHFSDICRVALLYQHGGMWFDATDYLTSKVPQWIEEADVFIFRDGPRFTPQKFIQSCFMRAKKGHPLYKAWLDFLSEYWLHEDTTIDYFLLHFMLRFLVDNNKEVNRLFYEMPQVPQTPTHLLWHLHRAHPFSEDLYKECTKDTFFQKTSFKELHAIDPLPGSVAEFIIKKKIPEEYNL